VVFVYNGLEKESVGEGEKRVGKQRERERR
jgi:hypothetical protein